MDLSADVDYHDLLKMPNNKGTTPKLLLDALNKLMYDDTMEELDSSDSSSNNSQMVRLHSAPSWDLMKFQIPKIKLKQGEQVQG